MEFFHILGAGARFNKKRFSHDVNTTNTLANGSGKSFSSKAASSALPSEGEVASLLDEMDMLPGGGPTQTTALKRRKTAAAAAAAKKEAERAEKAKKATESSSDEEESGSDEDAEDDDEEEEGADEATTLPCTTPAEVKAYRAAKKIRVYGDDVPRPMPTFEEMSSRYGVAPYLLENATANSFMEPTAIQQQAIPVILSGRELMACAPTGSGKTLAFTLPILHALEEPKRLGYRAVIVSPTRELAQQIYGIFKSLAQGCKFKICMLTKATASTQAHDPRLREKFDILITTPLRLVHSVQQSEIDLSKVTHLVLDEADKLLEAGFLEQMDEIVAACSNPKVQKMLFSATLPSGVEALASTIMKDPIRVVIGQRNAATELIDQKLVYVGEEEGKLVGIRQMIQEGFHPPALIFVQSIERAKTLFHELIYDGINVDVIHAERTRLQRDNVVASFRAGKIWVLIATELMARGIDFKGVNLVINYDFPQSVQSYIHRIGRTGRAGRRGKAVTFFTKDDAEHLRSIVNVMRESGCEVADWMLKLSKPSQNARNKLKKRPIDRRTISTMSKYDKQKLAHKRQMVNDTKKRKERLAKEGEEGAKGKKRDTVEEAD